MNQARALFITKFAESGLSATDKQWHHLNPLTVFEFQDVAKGDSSGPRVGRCAVLLMNKRPAKRKRSKPSTKDIPPSDVSISDSDRSNVLQDSNTSVASDAKTGSKNPKRRRFQNVEACSAPAPAFKADDDKADLLNLIGEIVNLSIEHFSDGNGKLLWMTVLISHCPKFNYHAILVLFITVSSKCSLSPFQSL